MNSIDIQLGCIEIVIGLISMIIMWRKSPRQKPMVSPFIQEWGVLLTVLAVITTTMGAINILLTGLGAWRYLLVFLLGLPLSFLALRYLSYPRRTNRPNPPR